VPNAARRVTLHLSEPLCMFEDGVPCRHGAGGDPSPPVAALPRLPTRGLEVLPAAISAWAPSISPSLSVLTARFPKSGLICTSIRLRSMVRVEALMGRLRRPRMRPASASVRYQSHTSATVSALRAFSGSMASRSTSRVTAAGSYGPLPSDQRKNRRGRRSRLWGRGEDASGHRPTGIALLSPRYGAPG
jgi:hypothetical protein